MALTKDPAGSGSGGFNFTPSDTLDLIRPVYGINVATEGAVVLIGEDGREVTVYIAAGTAFPIMATRVLSTGTTASGFAGLTR